MVPIEIDVVPGATVPSVVGTNAHEMVVETSVEPIAPGVIVSPWPSSVAANGLPVYGVHCAFESGVMAVSELNL